MNNLLPYKQNWISLIKGDASNIFKLIYFLSDGEIVLTKKNTDCIIEIISENPNNIKDVPQSIIAEEINKIILSNDPSVGFECLFNGNILKIIFPELQDLSGVDSIDGMHHKDNFYHTLQVLDNISEKTDDLYLRWAAILHDIGKASTKRFEKGFGWTFHAHEMVGSQMVPSILKRFDIPEDKILFIQKLVLLHQRPVNLTKGGLSDSNVRRLIHDCGEDISSLMILCKSDISSKNKDKIKRFHENYELLKNKIDEVIESDKLKSWQPVLRGEDIMKIFGLKPGRDVGILKDLVRTSILNGKLEDSYERSYEFIIKMAKEMGINPVNHGEIA